MAIIWPWILVNVLEPDYKYQSHGLEANGLVQKGASWMYYLNGQNACLLHCFEYKVKMAAI